MPTHNSVLSSFKSEALAGRIAFWAYVVLSTVMTGAGLRQLQGLLPFEKVMFATFEGVVGREVGLRRTGFLGAENSYNPFQDSVHQHHHLSLSLSISLSLSLSLSLSVSVSLSLHATAIRLHGVV